MVHWYITKKKYRRPVKACDTRLFMSELISVSPARAAVAWCR